MYQIFSHWYDSTSRFVCLLVGCLTSQQHATVSQGRICTDNFTCCHTETEAADQTFSLTQSPYTDTGPTSPSADPITPGACHRYDSAWKEDPRRKRESHPGAGIMEADDRQGTTVFTVQPSFHHRHSTNRVS